MKEMTIKFGTKVSIKDDFDPNRHDVVIEPHTGEPGTIADNGFFSSKIISTPDEPLRLQTAGTKHDDDLIDVIEYLDEKTVVTAYLAAYSFFPRYLKIFGADVKRIKNMPHKIIRR